MEFLPFNMEDFERWKLSVPIIKVCDMDENMKNQALEHIISGIEKCSGSYGVDI